jgi:hypothetical protein
VCPVEVKELWYYDVDYATRIKGLLGD